MLTVGSLFAGIGGFDLGFERAGFDVRWQVEIDPWARAVLEKHWPAVHRHDDVRTANIHNLEPVDVMVGGFPCQDISNAHAAHDGGMRGLEGERSGLWREYARLVGELQPRWVVIENVGALAVRGLAVVLHDLADSGFDADWTVVPASSLGAPHHRNRLFIVARRAVRFAHEMTECPCGCDEPWCVECDDHYADCRHPGPHSWLELLEDADGAGLEGDVRSVLAQPDDWRQYADAARSAWGNTTPRVCRGADGIPHRVDRLRGLGNAVVPQVAEWIARRILAAEGGAR